MKVYLLRHGETEYNTQQRYLGRSDIPLSPKGLADLIPADVCPQTVYISPLRRTAETAKVLFPTAHLTPVEGLREMDFGIFEGRTYSEMANLPEYREWVDGGCLDRIPGGEGKADFCRRACAAFSMLADQAADAGEELLAIVAHGGTQMAVLERYALPSRDYFAWRGPYGGGFVLDASCWRTDRTLKFLDTVQYTKGGAK